MKRSFYVFIFRKSCVFRDNRRNPYTGSFQRESLWIDFFCKFLFWKPLLVRPHSRCFSSFVRERIHKLKIQIQSDVRSRTFTLCVHFQTSRFLRFICRSGIHCRDEYGKIIVIGLSKSQSCSTTRHEGAWGERRCSSYSFTTSALDGVSGQRHAPAALYPRGRDPRYPLYRRLGGPHSRSRHRG
jgi:hypothetical protein